MYIKLRIDFLTLEDKNDLLQLLQQYYEIINFSKVRVSKDPNSKMKIQYIELMEKHNDTTS